MQRIHYPWGANPNYCTEEQREATRRLVTTFVGAVMENPNNMDESQIEALMKEFDFTPDYASRVREALTEIALEAGKIANYVLYGSSAMSCQTIDYETQFCSDQRRDYEVERPTFSNFLEDGTLTPDEDDEDDDEEVAEDDDEEDDDEEIGELPEPTPQIEPPRLNTPAFSIPGWSSFQSLSEDIFA